MLDDIYLHKKKLAEIYYSQLTNDFVKPLVENNYHDIYHIYNVRYPERDRLRSYLLKNNVITEIHYPIPPHKQKALVNLFGNLSFPISEEIHRTTLSLPISFFHTSDDIIKVTEIMNNFH